MSQSSLARWSSRARLDAADKHHRGTEAGQRHGRGLADAGAGAGHNANPTRHRPGRALGQAFGLSQSLR
jgi:hypothetical protein